MPCAPPSPWPVVLLVLASACGAHPESTGRVAAEPRVAAPRPSPRILPPPPERGEADGGRLRLCSWNVKKLGHGSSTDHDLVAAIVEDLCDLAVIVEVMQRQGGHPGWDRLREALGPGWDGVVTDRPRPNTSAGHAEHYGMLMRRAVVRLCDGWVGLRHHPDNDGGAGGSGPDRFSREPAYGCFVSGELDFLLAAYHATWSDGRTADIAGEVGNLGDVLATMSAAREEERDLLIAGDFNLVPEALARVLPFYDATSGSGSTLDGHGSRTDNLYDHLLVENKEATWELLGDAVVVDVRDRAASPEVFFRTVSDHLPLVAVFDTGGPDDD